MNKDNNEIRYSAEDIEKYFSGSLPDAAMHAMEKAALDDPFLAEAMEGYEAMKGREWNTTLIALRNQVAAGKNVAKVIPLRPATGRLWKIAAAVLVIGCGTTLTYFLTKEKSIEKTDPRIAEVITPAKDSNTATTTQTATSPQQKPSPEKTAAKQVVKTNDLIKSADKEEAVTKNISGKLNKPILVPNGNLEKTDQSKDDGLLTNKEPEKKPVTVSTTSPAAPAYNNNTGTITEMARSKKEEINNPAKMNTDEKKKVNQNVVAFKSQPLNRSFNAQVLGPDNSPLPFSNITIKSENFGTYADVKGNFRLVSSDSVLNVEVKSVGYLPTSYTLRSNSSQNKIVLAEDETANKTTTIIKSKNPATNKNTMRARLVSDSAINVEPADGWDNYNTYIANNIELPDDIMQNNKHGEIGISFDLKSNGRISNIRIDQSDCNDCKELAKRLIEQGPQWKLKKGKKASAKVKVEF